MGLLELFIIAVGLSMDAFAVSVCSGMTMQKAGYKKMLTVGLYFGIFQAVMPLIGYFLGSQFADSIIEADHWIAFGLLCFIGGKMIIESFAKAGCRDRACPSDSCCTDRACPGGENPKWEEASLRPSKMLPLAIATSIDALAVGITFAFLRVDVLPAVTFIGVVTLVISAAGVRIGSIFGTRFKSKAEMIGGIVLILIGTKILLQHLGIF
jgi:putative Mn2+ efflux pump MntP